ncbi:sigma-70 family RNA polymerase sigma factor [Actinomadura sp. 3N407]|uniref:sigma-70 family RNA polymerase sigma factor n=1 Tax=Actinomadura sp. 3N407 TaxID=3457423 RepID=UPI003FCD5CD5
MTETTQRPGQPMADDREFSAAEIEAFQREQFFIDPAEVCADTYPRVWNLSAGMLYRRVVRALAPDRAEYVTVPLPRFGPHPVELSVAITRWNLLWEAAQFRRRFFAEDQLPPQLRQVADRGDVNVMFVPRTDTRYHEYAPLFHLLPRAVLRRHGLPLLRCGQWPFLNADGPVDHFLGVEFESRLARAWADVVWRYLSPGSPVGAFSADDPIRLLAHNLDFWLPPVTAVMQEILRGFPMVDDTIDQEPTPLEDGRFLDGAISGSPRVGSDLWRGEAEAAEVVEWTVQEADADGRLRGILDAVRSNRVEEDFSNRWSYAREDFERKLYRKRSKIKVRFVELTDTIPVQGPDAEVDGELVCADFLSLLDVRQRQIVVLLNSGYTRLGDVADMLGYANHSPVSKRLARVRRRAESYFDRS